jgi:hypothetical protein
MTIRVFKYVFSPGPDSNEFVVNTIPGRVLSVAGQHGQLCVWIQGSDIAPLVRRVFCVVGTGHPCDECEQLPFLGTVLLYDGKLVLHVFDRSSM